MLYYHLFKTQFENDELIIDQSSHQLVPAALLQAENFQKYPDLGPGPDSNCRQSFRGKRDRRIGGLQRDAQRDDRIAGDEAKTRRFVRVQIDQLF